jgi:hypothetical protein
MNDIDYQLENTCDSNSPMDRYKQLKKLGKGYRYFFTLFHLPCPINVLLLLKCAGPLEKFSLPKICRLANLSH